MQENLEELATLESLDNGKPYTIAKTVDVPMASLSASSLEAKTDTFPRLPAAYRVHNLCWAGVTPCSTSWYTASTQHLKAKAFTDWHLFTMQSIEHLRYYGGWADKIYGAFLISCTGSQLIFLFLWLHIRGMTNLSTLGMYAEVPHCWCRPNPANRWEAACRALGTCALPHV